MESALANLEVFASTLLELAREDSDLLVVTSDSRGSAKLAPFAKAAPGQIVEVGIAEQNLVGIAAGLAAVGKNVFAVSPACFLTARSLEQIKNDVCYSDRPVSLVGISAGVSYGALGTTHHSLHDFAVLRAIHNITIVAPADNFETREAIKAAADLSTPAYLRFGKKTMPHLPRAKPGFELGKASLVRQGNDITFIACGETVAPAVAAAESEASARPMALAARFGVIDVITSPDRTIHHGKAPARVVRNAARGSQEEGSASGRALARSWQPRRHRNLFL